MDLFQTLHTLTFNKIIEKVLIRSWTEFRKSQDLFRRWAPKPHLSQCSDVVRGGLEGGSALIRKKYYKVALLSKPIAWKLIFFRSKILIQTMLVSWLSWFSPKLG